MSARSANPVAVAAGAAAVAVFVGVLVCAARARRAPLTDSVGGEERKKPGKGHLPCPNPPNCN
ncbi:hypothetical protein [Kitasatospora sp. NPDC094011]|uniref:hypothetical protein n=1 Tax=Kitasatospora sp. NPDC094011 TaxID=3364090 RepID=UPI0038162A4F